MLTIDPAVFKTYPGTQMGILAMRKVDAKAPPDPSVITEATDAIGRRYGQLDRAGLKALMPIKVYVEYYRKFGYNYHVLGQLESTLSGKRKAGAASGVLSAMFLTELESMLLTAGHDLDALKTPLKLKVATGEEQFQSISGKEAQTISGDLVVYSGNDVISSILRGPDLQSKITDATTSVLFTVYALPGIQKGAVESALHAMEDRIRSASPGCETVALAVHPL